MSVLMSFFLFSFKTTLLLNKGDITPMFVFVNFLLSLSFWET